MALPSGLDALSLSQAERRLVADFSAGSPGSAERSRCHDAQRTLSSGTPIAADSRRSASSTLQGGIDVDAMMYYLVDPHGEVYAKVGAQSFADLARECGVVEPECQEYRFDLSSRRLIVDRATPASALAVQEDVSNRVGSPERLMAFAEQGQLPKLMLVDLLSLDQRQPYLEACAQIERRYTEACTAKNDPCLESGCSVEGEDEICLQPLLNAGIEYQQACAAEWIKLFRVPRNRIDAWKN